MVRSATCWSKNCQTEGSLTSEGVVSASSSCWHDASLTRVHAILLAAPRSVNGTLLNLGSKIVAEATRLFPSICMSRN